MNQQGAEVLDNAIALYHRQCYENFVQILANLRPSRHRFQDSISFADVSNELDRYKLWSGNVGAAHDGPNYRLSLDYRLREAPPYKEQICDILNRLAEAVSTSWASIH